MESGLKKLYELHNMLFNSEANVDSYPLTIDDVKRLAHEEYQMLISHIPICIHTISLDKKLTSINPAGLEMLGETDESNVLDQDYLSFVSQEDTDKVNQLLDKAILEGERSSFKFTSADGILYIGCFIPITNNSKIVKILGYTQNLNSDVQ